MPAVIFDCNYVQKKKIYIVHKLCKNRGLQIF